MKKNAKLFTEAELEYISVLWKLGQGTVNDVIAGLASEKKPAYTTVSTILRILEQKGAVVARKEGRGHVYVPKISKAEYESRALNQVVHKVFDGTPVALVRQLLGKMKPQEVDEVKALLERLEKK